ncbi:MAG TPA: DUF3857 domain-containing protein [Pyrinomonadaceae bacterium]|jgi:hypothetical protein|nr:DUF3857 domain-containing protein [Pyrinomonadaceae bacterium]
MQSPRSAARAGARLALALSLLVLACAPAALAGDKDWKPIDPTHLAMKEPAVEKDADAEVVFWEVRVSYEDNGGQPSTVLSHYVRIKIFNERGRDAQSKVDLPELKFRGRNIKIKDIAGRTVKPDGQIVELKKEDVYQRDLVKASGVKLKARSFALPGVEPGSLIEYRWREVRDGITSYERFDFSRDIPVQSVTYYIKPYGDALVDSEGRSVGLRAQTFHGNMTPFAKKDGFYVTSMTNVPAFREEPKMPPPYAVRPWMLAFYGTGSKLPQPQQFWSDYARKLGAGYKSRLKAGDEVKKAAAEQTAGAQTDDEKLERLFKFVRSHVKKVTDDALGLTPDQLKKIKENKSPTDTLKRGMGDGWDINYLFGALAQGAGFEVRMAAASDREDIFFDPEFPDDYFINPTSIAVRVGDKWRLFDPGTTYTTFGMLRWQEEGQQTLIADEKAPAWVMSPVSPPHKSVEKRTAKLKLADDGTLEGDVRIEYTGHIAADVKEYYDDDSPAQREESVKNQVKRHFGTADVTDVKMENVTDPDKPIAYSFHVRVPGYAQRTGKRLFLKPAFFQNGEGPMFTTTTRRHLVYFHYPWAEQDEVELSIPEGFALDNAEAPAPFGSGSLTQYKPSLGVTDDGRVLIYKRSFFFGGGNHENGAALVFPTTSYPQLKTYFDQVSTQDGHTIALKQGAPAPATGAQK